MAPQLLTALLLPLVGSSLVACTSSSQPAASLDSEESVTETSISDQVEHLTVEIVATHEFDDTSFTQGLEVEPGGTLLVGTGWEGESRIYRTTLDGQQTNEHRLPDDQFGEGITRHGDTVWQLTWQDGVAYQRDAATLEQIGQASYPGEGWGLCSFPGEIIMSDGTAVLRRVDPETFVERDRFAVTLNGQPVDNLNELECVDGDIYANLFLATTIVRIDAATGEVTGVIDGSGIPNNATPDPNHVLNGIAHIPGTDRFYVTGKRWPDLYEVRFVPAG